MFVILLFYIYLHNRQHPITNHNPRLIINSTYIYDDIEFGSLGSPVAVSFSNLPDGTLIEEITFKFTKATGAGFSAIGEVTFVTKKD